MKSFLRQLIETLVGIFITPLSDNLLSQIIFTMIVKRVNTLSPSKALRFLFSLDDKLYHLQGRTAIRYDNGIHPKHRLMDYHRFFISRITAKDKVLDIGCGNGAVAFDIAKSTGASVVGIDINEENIKIAKQRHQHENLTFIQGDALVELPNDLFNVVMLSNVLEHLPNRASFLRKVNETIHPQSVLIRVPLFERDWRVPLKKELGVEWRLDDTHEIEYTLKTFAEEMAAAGLNIKHLDVCWGEIWSELTPQTE